MRESPVPGLRPPPETSAGRLFLRAPSLSTDLALYYHYSSNTNKVTITIVIICIIIIIIIITRVPPVKLRRAATLRRKAATGALSCTNKTSLRFFKDG